MKLALNKIIVFWSTIQPIMILKLTSLFSIVLFAMACTPEGRIFSENKELSPELEWLKQDTREFKVTVDDITSTYDLSLMFRYATGFQYKTANVRVTEISPNGEEVVSEYKLSIRDDNGDYLGEPALDIWDSEHLVETKKTYKETGTYTYVMEHAMINDPMQFVMEIGLIVDKSK